MKTIVKSMKINAKEKQVKLLEAVKLIAKLEAVVGEAAYNASSVLAL